MILPLGKDIEVDILRERINHLPKELLQDEQIIQDCRSASIDEDGKVCSKKNLDFWKILSRMTSASRPFRRSSRKSLSSVD